jgi:hypothetical protein
MKTAVEVVISAAEVVVGEVGIRRRLLVVLLAHDSNRVYPKESVDTQLLIITGVPVLATAVAATPTEILMDLMMSVIEAVGVVAVV